MATGLKALDLQADNFNYLEWSNNLPYNKEIVVSYNKHLYISLIDKNIGNHPITSNFWTFII